MKIKIENKTKILEKTLQEELKKALTPINAVEQQRNISHTDLHNFGYISSNEVDPISTSEQKETVDEIKEKGTFAKILEEAYSSVEFLKEASPTQLEQNLEKVDSSYIKFTPADIPEEQTMENIPASEVLKHIKDKQYVYARKTWSPHTKSNRFGEIPEKKKTLENNKSLLLDVRDSNGDEILKISSNGDICVRGRLLESDFQFTEALRRFLRDLRYLP